MKKRQSRLWQATRFCIAGAAGVVAYYAALYCLTEFLGVWYIASAVVGFVLNTGLSFVLQKYWTFRNKETRLVTRQIVLYVTMNVMFLIGNVCLLYIMVQYLHMWYIGAQIILTVVFSTLSYFISDRIFKDEIKPTASA
jgi:dolichol-phosphate mannosyltransferase